MFDNKILIACCLGVAVLLGLVAYLLIKRSRDHFSDTLEYEEIPERTSPEVEFIEGEPDMHVVSVSDGKEFIPTGDISLGAGYGVGEGMFGFGRYQNSFMA
jgi:hypothetical protein